VHKKGGGNNENEFSCNCHKRCIGHHSSILAECRYQRLPQDIEFKAAPVQGAPQTAVLYGDPTKPGVFVTRVKFSAGWKDQPHWHPDEVRTVAVLSGTFYFASGETWDESKFKAYPAGTFYSEPPKAPHFTWAKDGEVIIQVTGVGPTGKTFIPQPK
jgi:quercetin dioxygenase-like cupin family protein